MKTITQVAAFALLAGASLSAYAYEAGDIVVRGGAAAVQPDDSSDGIAIPALNAPPIAGTQAEVASDTQLGLTVSYMFSSSLGLELLASTPFTHAVNANLNGVVAGLNVAAGEVSHLPPTLSLVYYPFADSDSALQAYVGVGVNYTIFFDEEVDPALEALTGGLAGAPSAVPMNLNVDDSVGLALQLGADYALGNSWHVNAAVRWIDISTDARFTSALGETITVDNIEIDPFVYQLSVGYTF